MLISTTHYRPESGFVRETYQVTSSLTIIAFWLNDKNLLNPPTWTFRIGVPSARQVRRVTHLSLVVPDGPLADPERCGDRPRTHPGLDHYVYRVDTWANRRTGVRMVARGIHRKPEHLDL